MAIPVAKHHLSRQEYLRLEASATDKHEFHAGEVLAMSGGTYEHSRILTNIIAALASRLKGGPCFPLESNMRVCIAREDRYVYPDALVVCGEPQFDPDDENRTTIVNPRLVVEVLSDSTEAYDRGAKFTAYRTLTSMEEYVLVSQREPLVESFRRQSDGFWIFAPIRGIDAVAAFTSIGVEVPLSEIYHGLPMGS